MESSFLGFISLVSVVPAVFADVELHWKENQALKEETAKPTKAAVVNWSSMFIIFIQGSTVS